MRTRNSASRITQNDAGFTLFEILVVLAIVVFLLSGLVYFLSDKSPEPRPAATIAEELVGAIGAVVSWKEAFFGASPSIDDSPCAEARRLVDRASALLAEYAANPQKDQAVFDKQTQQIDGLMPALRRWCPSYFP